MQHCDLEAVLLLRHGKSGERCRRELPGFPADRFPDVRDIEVEPALMQYARIDRQAVIAVS